MLLGERETNRAAQVLPHHAWDEIGRGASPSLKLKANHAYPNPHRPPDRHPRTVVRAGERWYEMRTIYECTDCKYCANFSFGYRVFCLHPDLPSDEVCKYAPVEDDNTADDCAFFDGEFNYDHQFSMKELTDEAEPYSEVKHNGEVTYEGIREWCLQKVKPT